jgi:hypothetical protein
MGAVKSNFIWHWNLLTAELEWLQPPLSVSHKDQSHVGKPELYHNTPALWNNPIFHIRQHFLQTDKRSSGWPCIHCQWSANIAWTADGLWPNGTEGMTQLGFSFTLLPFIETRLLPSWPRDQSPIKGKGEEIFLSSTATRQSLGSVQSPA